MDDVNYFITKLFKVHFTLCLSLVHTFMRKHKSNGKQTQNIHVLWANLERGNYMGNEHVIVFNCTCLPLDILELNFLLGQYPCRKTYFMQQYDIKYIVGYICCKLCIDQFTTIYNEKKICVIFNLNIYLFISLWCSCSDV